MLAVLWQGELMAAWEAVAEDVDFQQTFPETAQFTGDLTQRQSYILKGKWQGQYDKWLT
jgi:hypothetical protein